jgi:redox-sensitive bicupin YhaK (pirin superfamily)
MTVEVRRESEIFAADGGWFHARWHFSFDHYRDPEHRGVGALRVFNDDRLEPGAVWPMHPHRDIESCTYVVEGRFSHADSLGNDGVLQPGAAQVMRFSSAGAEHSERNGSETEGMRFLQFWLLPSDDSLESTVQQHQYGEAERTNRFLQIMGPAGEDGLDVAQDARVLVSRLLAGNRVSHTVASGRGGYFYVIDGAVELGVDKLVTGDAAEVHGPETLDVVALDDAEVIVVDTVLDFRPVGVWARAR